MNGSFRGLPLAIPRVAGAFGTHPVRLRDSDAIDQNDRARNNLYWRKRPRIQMQFQQTRISTTCSLFRCSESWLLSVAVTPNWGMQGTQSHSSSFHHVSILHPTYLNRQRASANVWHYSTFLMSLVIKYTGFYQFFFSLFNSLFSRQVSPSKSQPRSGTRPSVGWWRGWMIWTSTSEMKP